MADEPQQRYSELASFGEELRREREIRGISLKEISDATKISKRFLEAIERNDHKTLPAPVFTRGFVREYARYLGLNSEDIVNRYNFAAAGDDRIEQSQHLERLTQPQAPPLPRDRVPAGARKSIPPPYARIDRNIYILGIIVAALLGASWWAFKHKRETRAEEARAEAATTTIAAKPAAPPPVPVPEPQIDDTLRLTIDVSRDSWVTLQADGKKILDERLREGDHRTFEAKEAFHFVAVGNAGGLAMKLNDIDLPSLGKRGQVVKDKTFDRGTLQELRSEAQQNRT